MRRATFTPLWLVISFATLLGAPGCTRPIAEIDAGVDDRTDIVAADAGTDIVATDMATIDVDDVAADGIADQDDTGPVEPPVDVLATDAAGHLLTVAYGEYVPTEADRQLAILVIIGLVETQRTGEVHPVLMNPSIRDELQVLAAHFPSLRPPTGSGMYPLISSPPQCTDNCLPDPMRALRAIGRLASRLTPASSITGVGALSRLVLNLTARRDIGTASAEQLRGDVRANLLPDEQIGALDQLGTVLMPAGALIQFATDTGLITGGSLLPAGVAATAAVIAAGAMGWTLGAALNDAYQAWSDCRDWQLANCDMDAGTDAESDVGDGGPDADLDAAGDAADACPIGYADCGEGFCTNLAASYRNCGVCGTICASGLCVGGACVDRSSTPCDTNDDGVPDIDCERDYCASLGSAYRDCPCLRYGRVGSGLRRACWTPGGFECANSAGTSFAICYAGQYCRINLFDNPICSNTP